MAVFKTNALLMDKLKQLVESQKPHFAVSNNKKNIIARRSTLLARLRSQIKCWETKPFLAAVRKLVTAKPHLEIPRDQNFMNFSHKLTSCGSKGEIFLVLFRFL